MDISINSRMATSSESVVLDTHVWFTDEPNPVVTFLAEVHQENPKDIFCGDCGYLVGTPPVFQCAGVGLKEWSEAHAFFDLLYVKDYQAKTRVQMDTWIHESITRGVESCLLRIEVRNKVVGCKDSGQFTSWVALKLAYHKSDGPSLVVPQNGTTTLTKSYVDSNFTPPQPPITT